MTASMHYLNITPLTFYYCFLEEILIFDTFPMKAIEGKVCLHLSTQCEIQRRQKRITSLCNYDMI